MSITIQYAARVVDDIQLAFEYYYTQQNAPQAAEKFLDDIEDTLGAIRRNPYTFSIRYNDIRCAVLKTFPYLIHYQIQENSNTILIIAVANTHQKPLW